MVGGRRQAGVSGMQDIDAGEGSGRMRWEEGDDDGNEGKASSSWP